MEASQQIITTCQNKLVGANLHACNYFVRDVATALGVNDNNFLNTTANAQVDQLRGSANWQNLGQGNVGAAAALAEANAGKLVIAGWKSSSGHGHVAIAVHGSAINGWPRGYWGHLGGLPGSNQGLRESFGENKRPTTEFFARAL